MEILFFLFVVGLFFLWNQVRLNELNDRLTTAERRIEDLLYELQHKLVHPTQPFGQPPSPPQMEPAVVETIDEKLPPPLPLPPPIPIESVTKPQTDSGSLEVTIGQSWLSKIAVVSLLIAVSLFLISTLSSNGPWGKAITAFGVSLLLLLAGIWFERGSRPKSLAWSMIGGGWAGIYFTTYAIHGLEPVRLVQSPTIAMMLLLGVALVMVLHSLRYESQTVTAIAFCAAFAAFEVAPLDLFNSLAGIPLLLFLLFLSRKKQWQTLALSGIVFAYVAASLNFHSTDSVRYAYEWGQPIFWTYWLLIEAYDFLSYDAQQPVFPLNASGLLAATLLTGSWSPYMKPDHFIELASIAFLISALLRYIKQRDTEQESLEQLSPGGFTASMIVSSLLASVAIAIHFSDVPRIFAWTLHAQVLVLAGYQLKNKFLSTLGSILFVLPAAQLISVTPPSRIGSWRSDTHMAALLASLLYFNRFVLKLWEPLSYLASFIVGFFLFQETPANFRPLAFTLLALGFASISKKELLIQSAGFAAASLVILIAAPPTSQYWITLGIPTAIYAAAAWVLRQQTIPRQAAISATNLFAAYFIFRVIPEPWIAAGWAFQMLALWTLGVHANLLMPRLQCVPLAGVIFVYLVDKESQVHKLIPLRLFVLVCFFAVGLLRPYLKDTYTRIIHPAMLVVAIGMLTALITDNVAANNYTIAWAVEAAGLILLGIPVADRIVRFAGLFVFALCVGRALIIDLPARDSTGRILTFLGLGLLLLAVSWAYTQFGSKIKAYLKDSESE